MGSEMCIRDRRSLNAKRAAQAGWILPEHATLEQISAARCIQAHFRGRRSRKAHGLVGKLARNAALAQERAEISMIKYPCLGLVCNFTTRWGCSWSNSHRQSLLVIAGVLIVLAFLVQKVAFLGLFLNATIVRNFPWVEYQVRSQLLIAILLHYNVLNSSNISDVARINVLIRNNTNVSVKGNIWGQCAWPVGAAWGSLDGNSHCWTM